MLHCLIQWGFSSALHATIAVLYILPFVPLLQAIVCPDQCLIVLQTKCKQTEWMNVIVRTFFITLFPCPSNHRWWYLHIRHAPSCGVHMLRRLSSASPSNVPVEVASHQVRHCGMCVIERAAEASAARHLCLL